MQPGMISQTVSKKTPRGWLECRGQELRIEDYRELYEAIGTEFGSEGKDVFNIPRLASDARGPRYIIFAGKTV